MRLTPRNELLYDAKNFDKYNNIYTILLNNVKLENLEMGLSQYDHKLHVDYILLTEEIHMYFLSDKYLNLNGIYKIIFGHYYNNSNTFLYKNLKKDKVISFNVKHCKNNELLYNENNNLICSNSYETLKKQIDIFVNNKVKQLKEEYFPLEITYNNENVNIDTNKSITIHYDNECVEIINI
jgi:hypothetical protein